MLGVKNNEQLYTWLKKKKKPGMIIFRNKKFKIMA